MERHWGDEDGAEADGWLDEPCAARAPPVMLWVISLRPAFMLSILAGVVCGC
jgi:hypothetical protein